jgi:PPK2 family polyphosphate:nucleotide phosphotransferase
MDYDKILVKPGKKIVLKDYDTAYTGDFKDKSDAKEKLKSDIKKLSDLQYKLYASNKYSLLIIFQALDAAGKDGTIKHVMTGVNPQGCEVTSFKAPTPEELEHDFLWRCYRRLPRKGEIGIFNRSYYEEVLVTRVHPELIIKQRIPGVDSLEKINNDFWQSRYKQINRFEKHLSENGIRIIKFFLHVSKEEQRKRFLKRIDDPDKNWKFSMEDINERKFWKDFQKAYEDAVSNTSTEFATWYIIPADHKWFMRTAVGDIIVKALESLELTMPELSKDSEANLQKAKGMLLDEEEKK